MKHCPACNFSFPDFHLVCDFDGTELVPDRQRRALIKLPARRSFVRRLMRSPKMLAALAMLGLFLAATLIAYQQMKSRSTSTFLAANVATPSLETSATASSSGLDTSTASFARPNVAVKAPIRSRRSSAVRFVVRSRRAKDKEHPSPQTAVAHGSGSLSSDRQPKLVAMLKTTWRVLKRPFSF